MPSGFRYSRWDGTQAGFDLDADDVLSRLTDDLIYHGDPDAALRRLLAEGLTGPGGERVAGLRELVERLRRRRQEELADNDLGGAFSEIARELHEIVAQEQEAIDATERDAVRSGDERRRQTAEVSAAERRMRLDLLPSNLAGQVQDLSSYDFTSAEAGRRFDDLVERLRRELLQSRLNEMTGAMADLGPEQLQRTKDMLAALNHLIDERARGKGPSGPLSGEQNIEPGFAAFMAAYGDFFPENPRSLDELLEQLAAQAAAFQSFVNSLSAGQRAELARLSDQLLGDVDLRWQLDQLSRNLQSRFPDLGWADSYQSSGRAPMSMLDAVDMVDRLGQIDALQRLLSGAASPGALAEVDPEVARDLLGDDGARSLDRLGELARTLAEAGLIEQREGRLELTPRGLRRIGQNALTDLFARLDADRLGHHPDDREGPGHERSYDTKAYEFGDPFNLNIERTIRTSLLRTGGLPISLHADDFEVERTETLTRASTVLAIDLSLSMPMRDNFLAAKKTAVALHSLISGRYPSDYLGLVGFSEVARVLRPDQLPEVSWDFVFGTNMHHALLLARRMLAGRPGTRQILMITDGEPTAHITADGEPLFHYPPTSETVEATLNEVVRCTREGIRINTFMLDVTPHLQTFVERLSRINRGRVFFTTPDTLGDYVLVDFLDQKRARRTGRSA